MCTNLATSTFQRPLVVEDEESQKNLFEIINAGKVNERMSILSPFLEEKEEKLIKQFASNSALK